MERGVPLLGGVRERWTPAAAPAPDPRSVAPPPGRISAAVRRPTHRLARPVFVAATLAAGPAGTWGLPSPRAPHPRAAAPPPPAPVRAPSIAAPPARTGPSLSWSGSLAAYP